MNNLEKYHELQLFLNNNKGEHFDPGAEEYTALFGDDLESVHRQYEQHDLSEMPDEEFYSNLNTEELLEFRRLLLFHSAGEKKQDFFTISFSKNNKHIDYMLADDSIYSWSNYEFYTPLNHHSRAHLKQGDILFCYQMGGWSPLSRALSMRGIYGIGIALSDPIFFGDDEDNHTHYGIPVCLPLRLSKHLAVKNIQMHPLTIDLTPYNGNRNDALQHIKKEEHYQAILDMVSTANPNLRKAINAFTGYNPIINELPSNALNNIYKLKSDEISEEEKASIDLESFKAFVKSRGYTFPERMLERLVISLATKPFLILTGVSGTGKTKAAQLFAQWCNLQRKAFISKFELLEKALNSQVITEKYGIRSNGSHSVEMVNKGGSSGKAIPLPKELIIEWYEAVKKGVIKDSQEANEKRSNLFDNSAYQAHIHGFYTNLFDLASEMLSIEERDGQRVAQDLESNATNYAVIPVGPEWTDKTDLLGFFNTINGRFERTEALNLIMKARKHETKGTPFFLILDEMNLSHVERYFADFLSAMESGESIPLHEQEDEHDVPKQLTIPENLFVLGTVNIDETTYMFSPKVLDRSNVLEFGSIRPGETHSDTSGGRVSQDSMIYIVNSSRNRKKMELRQKLKDIQANEEETVEFKVIHHLDNFHRILDPVGFGFGHRTVEEILRYLIKCWEAEEEPSPWENWNLAMDEQIMQKILPKIHGSQRKLGDSLNRLYLICFEGHASESSAATGKTDSDNSSLYTEGCLFPESAEKLGRMKNKLDTELHTSFIE